ncbi:transcriptional repressor LexA [Mariniblastus fucicola]|uniref:LexA repressor n=1 Tax=Mariniblastus fucicola TaxID=980251 RepID=A0A5B9PPB5_9BACT|nr:transcriptional repressor LexA [Mariniblastus fucicola]QEG24103.1 LexA repressor [Mariniblastus fucicola]
MAPETKDLTKNQRRVLKYLKQQIEHKNHVPTIREIGDHLGISSPNGVAGLLKRIEAKGMIKRTKNRARSIVLTEKCSPAGLPLVGRISAGPLTETFAQAERFEFDGLERRADYVLEVTGESMIDAQIAPGDFVLVKKQSTADRGDIVVVCDDENGTTLKYWYPEKNRVRLQPANKTMKPIYRKDVRVQGVVIGLVRKL